MRMYDIMKMCVLDTSTIRCGSPRPYIVHSVIRYSPRTVSLSLLWFARIDSNVKFDDYSMLFLAAREPEIFSISVFGVTSVSGWSHSLPASTPVLTQAFACEQLGLTRHVHLCSWPHSLRASFGDPRRRFATPRWPPSEDAGVRGPTLL